MLASVALVLALGATTTLAAAQPLPAAAGTAPASSASAAVSVAPERASRAVPDRRRKENFRAVDGEALLRSVRGIAVTSWSYTGHDEAVRHIGPLAQDWRQTFGPAGDSPAIESLENIESADMAGIAFAGVKALEMRSNGSSARVEMLEQRLRELERRLAERDVLARRVQQLERRLESLLGKGAAERPY